MSPCADVCLSCSYYEGHNEFYRETTPVARKAHVCCECGDAINPGEKYQRACGKSDGYVFTETTCLVCTEIRAAFCCGSWTFRLLWESISEEMFPKWVRSGPYDCLAKLETEAARNKCRAEFADWERKRMQEAKRTALLKTIGDYARRSIDHTEAQR